MQLYNTQKSLEDASKICRFQKINSTYTELADIRDRIWLDAIDNARLLETNPDTTLFSGNATCNNFMLILEGTIRIYQTAKDGREITLYRVEAGGLCVLSLNSLLRNQSFNAIAITESNVRALVISSTSFKIMIDKISPFRNYVLSTLTERLCETIYLIQDTAFNHLNMRLACILDNLFERGPTLTLKITHQELASELGTTREVISRILKDFEKQNCIKLSRGYIKLASAEGLRWFTEPV